MKIEALPVQPWTPVGATVTRLTGPPRIGTLVAIGVAHGFTGLLTERNINAALRRHGVSVVNESVRAGMSRHVPTCGPEGTVATAMTIMTSTKRRHLSALEHGELLGIVSIGARNYAI